MILEVAVLDVRAGEDSRFERAFEQAQAIIASMPGYQRHELRRCVEVAGRYLLLVWWDSLKNTVGFRGSPVPSAGSASTILRSVPACRTLSALRWRLSCRQLRCV
jgi:heme-degrading monooxygenase HmoA